MGGKNPGIICPSADFDQAVAGVWKSAFGLSGQKCSALSRLIVHQDMADDFIAALVKATEGLVVGDPVKKETFMGPVIEQSAVDRYFAALDAAGKNGGRILLGGGDIREERPELKNGYFVKPVIARMPHEHPLTQKELFLPFLNVYTFSAMEEAMEMANDIPYGLTSGIFTKDQAEIDYYLEHTRAGCAYVNRPTA